VFCLIYQLSCNEKSQNNETASCKRQKRVNYNVRKEILVFVLVSWLITHDLLLWFIKLALLLRKKVLSHAIITQQTLPEDGQMEVVGV
jgi:hypothetical protein